MLNISSVTPADKLPGRLLSDLIGNTLKGGKQEDQIDVLTKQHFSKALQFYKDFEEEFLKTLSFDLKEIQKALNTELGRTIKKLGSKLGGSYAKQLGESLVSFYLEPFVVKEIKEVYKAVDKLKDKVYEYINQFCNQVLSRNLEKHNELSLFHFSN